MQGLASLSAPQSYDHIFISYLSYLAQTDK